jgi:DNA-directed RNA polymerase specialized sigma24 family protein
MEDIDKTLEDAFRYHSDYGIAELDQLAKLIILDCITRNGLGLTPADVDDVYGQTMMEMLRAARKPAFDPKNPIPLALTIAIRRTAKARERKRLRNRREGTEYKDAVTADLQGTRVGMRALFDDIDWQEFDEILWTTIRTLPQMQQLAATCFNDVYEEVIARRSYAPLADAMSQVLGRPVTVVAAKNNWHEAKKKIAEALNRKGWDL